MNPLILNVCVTFQSGGSQRGPCHHPWGKSLQDLDVYASEAINKAKPSAGGHRIPGTYQSSHERSTSHPNLFQTGTPQHM